MLITIVTFKSLLTRHSDVGVQREVQRSKENFHRFGYTRGTHLAHEAGRAELPP